MTTMKALIRRNVTLFFKDKGMFFTSLITPMILLVLYISFLGNVYRDSFANHLPEGMVFPEKILNGLVAGQLISSLLSVCCVTVAFCANMLMVQDKVNGARKDLNITPCPPATLALSYFLATLIVTLIICFATMGVGMLYMAAQGWYLTVSDLLLILLDVILLTLFGTSLSSMIHQFLSSQGQISAVGSIVSSCYGFVSGAYMPISQFSPALQKAMSFLPGTYGTVLMRRHAMMGALGALRDHGVPQTMIDEMAFAVDCKLKFFDHDVPEAAMYGVLIGTVVLLIGLYVFTQSVSIRKGNKK